MFDVLKSEEVTLFRRLDKGVDTFKSIVEGKILDEQAEQDIIDMVIAHKAIYHANLKLVSYGAKDTWLASHGTS